ncbi:MAG: cation diffusion facilitator family transporter [Chitinophagaceae bacterium]
MNTALENYQIQKKLTVVVIVLFAIKLIAWYLTNSIAILTDALEYTINVISGLIGLYSLYLSAKPKDNNHPYGHGKVEFLSSSIEGVLMIVSAFLIMYEAINNLRHPHSINKLDYGIILIGITALVNYLLGVAAINQGKKNNSLALMATGKHMQSDTYATIAIILGLVLIYFTHLSWIDSIVALIFAFIIIISGYKILRKSIAGIMDEADDILLNKLVAVLEKARVENWVDLHNLRIIKYGGTLHLDCHLTVPWYLNVHQAHKEIDALSELVKKEFGESLELFVHTDGCLDFSCKICSKKECPARKFEFKKKVVWQVENISSNHKHNVDIL